MRADCATWSRRATNQESRREAHRCDFGVVRPREDGERMEIQVMRLEVDEELDIDSMERSGSLPSEVMDSAASIIADVRERGDAALFEYTAKFDHVKLNSFLVPDELLAAAADRLDPDLRDALDVACINISDFHSGKVPQSTLDMSTDGSIVGYRVSPLDSVGLYIPGGRAPYPSTVLMNAIPAKMAGVERIVMVTPPSSDGTMDPALLYAASISGVDEVYAIGGAQAIAALTYGTESIPKVDKIVGPGNAYVAAAKKLVSGSVGTDMQAGPSEVLILADETSVPEFVAADMLSQAEHDPDACCYLVMVGDDNLNEILSEIERMAAEAERREIIEASLEENGLIVVCPNLSSAIETANGIAPEHLEIQMDNAMEIVGQLRHAGAIFVGTWSPVAVGDYIAGPSHTLPTSGTARFSNPLTTDDFVRKTSIISYSYPALRSKADAVMQIAGREGFTMHVRSVSERIDLFEQVAGELAGEGEDR